MPPIKRKRLTPTQRNRIACTQGWKCACCRKTLDFVFEVDHIVALCNGGEDVMTNLQVLCANCHAVKTYSDRFEQHEQQQESVPVTVSPYFSGPPKPKEEWELRLDKYRSKRKQAR
jgi:predicted HNH restriction endonuclease